MRKICALLCLALLLVSGVSCRKQPKDIQAAHIVRITDNDFKHTLHRASELYESVDFVFLETNDNCLMGRVSKVLVTEDHFIIKSAKAVFIFDRQGHFVRKIYHVGRGNGEYIGLNDVSLLSDGTVLLLDTSHKKMLGYTLSDSLLFDIKLPFSPEAAEELRSGMIAFAVSGDKEDRIALWDTKQSTIVKRFHPFDIRYAVSIDRRMIKHNNEVYYAQEFRPGLYKLNDDCLTWQWYIDAGNRTIEEKDLQPVDFFGATLYVPGSQKAVVGDFMESDHVLNFSYRCDDINEIPFDVFYSKSTHEKRISHQEDFIDDMTFFSDYHKLFTITPEGQYVCVYDVGRWIISLEDFRMKAKDLGLEDAYNALLPKLSGLKPDDNPVLALFKIKDF